MKAKQIKMTKARCAGCEDNFYNGNNSLGVKECWLFKTANIIERKRVPIWQRPPWPHPSEMLPNCYREKGYAIMNGDPLDYETQRPKQPKESEIQK